MVEKENFIFNIIGSGSEKNNLKKLEDEKKLLKKINFISFKKNPFPYIRMSDVFVMCSRFEGMSNTVLEALSLDKSILYLDNTGASTDLLRKNIIILLFIFLFLSQKKLINIRNLIKNIKL